MDRISIDEIDATLEMFEIPPEHQKPHPSFWDEVLALSVSIEDLIDRRSSEQCDLAVLETLIQLRAMTNALKQRYDENTIKSA